MKKQHANCDVFFFPFLPHKLNTLDFNLLIAYARAHTNVLCIVLGFYFFNFSIFHILGMGVLRPLLFFFSSFISSLVKPKKEKKAPLLFHSAILPGFNKKAIFFLPSWRSGCGLIYLLLYLIYPRSLLREGVGCLLACF